MSQIMSQTTSKISRWTATNLRLGKKFRATSNQLERTRVLEEKVEKKKERDEMMLASCIETSELARQTHVFLDSILVQTTTNQQLSGGCAFIYIYMDGYRFFPFHGLCTNAGKSST